MRRVSLGLAALVLAFAGFGLGARPAAAACPAQGCTVSIHDLAYDPATITVTTAEGIFWCNDETDHTVNHTVTSDDGKSFSSPTLTPGGDCFGGSAGEIGVGDYAYHCKIHSSMHGMLHIVAAATTTTTTAAPTTTTTAPAGVTTTTARPTTTTARPTTTTTRHKTTTTRKVTTVKRTTLTTAVATTTTSEETTTTDFETTTSEETTTTAGGFAINTSGKKDNGTTYALLGSLAIIISGGGYLLWRYRSRFIG